MFVLSSIGSLCSVSEPMGTDELSCSSFLFFIKTRALGKRVALLATCFSCFFFDLDDGGDVLLLNLALIFNGRHDVSQKTPSLLIL
jgi:hypothetical protein